MKVIILLCAIAFPILLGLAIAVALTSLSEGEEEIEELRNDRDGPDDGRGQQKKDGADR